VEATGVEPVSKNTSARASPGAVCRLEFPTPHADRQACGFGSFICHAALKALPGHVHHKSTPDTKAVVLNGRTAAALRRYCYSISVSV